MIYYENRKGQICEGKKGRMKIKQREVNRNGHM